MDGLGKTPHAIEIETSDVIVGMYVMTAHCLPIGSMGKHLKKSF